MLGGGYPELWAGELAENASMREQIRNKLLAGMPSLAECGGFLYLHEKMRLEDGKEYPMAGVIPGACYYTGRSVRFGYARFSCADGKSDGKNALRGHEFHYFDSENCGEDWIAEKPVTGRTWRCMHQGEEHLWGFAHLYYPSSPEFAKWFVECCVRYGRKKEER